MPTPNYQFEKRKRDLAKKAAKDEKKARKKEKGSSGPQIIEHTQVVDDEVSAEQATSAEDTPPAAAS